MFDMAIEDITDNERRWFAMGFRWYWMHDERSAKYRDTPSNFVQEFVAEDGKKRIHPATMSALINGKNVEKNFPGPKMRALLAEFFGTTPHEITAMGQRLDGRHTKALPALESPHPPIKHIINCHQRSIDLIVEKLRRLTQIAPHQLPLVSGYVDRLIEDERPNEPQSGAPPGKHERRKGTERRSSSRGR